MNPEHFGTPRAADGNQLGSAAEAELLLAQRNAETLFDAVIHRKWIRPGALESEISHDVFELASEERP